LGAPKKGALRREWAYEDYTSELLALIQFHVGDTAIGEGLQEARYPIEFLWSQGADCQVSASSPLVRHRIMRQSIVDFFVMVLCNLFGNECETDIYSARPPYYLIDPAGTFRIHHSNDVAEGNAIAEERDAANLVNVLGDSADPKLFCASRHPERSEVDE
jgi:hypothetical protein